MTTNKKVLCDTCGKTDKKWQNIVGFSYPKGVLWSILTIFESIMGKLATAVLTICHTLPLVTKFKGTFDQYPIIWRSNPFFWLFFRRKIAPKRLFIRVEHSIASHLSCRTSLCDVQELRYRQSKIWVQYKLSKTFFQKSSSISSFYAWIWKRTCQNGGSVLKNIRHTHTSDLQAFVKVDFYLIQCPKCTDREAHPPNMGLPGFLGGLYGPNKAKFKKNRGSLGWAF